MMSFVYEGKKRDWYVSKADSIAILANLSLEYYEPLTKGVVNGLAYIWITRANSFEAAIIRARWVYWWIRSVDSSTIYQALRLKLGIKCTERDLLKKIGALRVKLRCVRCDDAVVEEVESRYACDQRSGAWYQGIYCQECLKVKRSIDLEKWQQRQEVQTQEYMSVFLGQTESSISKRYEALRRIFTSSRESSEKLKTMPYQNFLETVYWEVISGYVKHRAHWHCQLCNSSSNLQTHHKTYEHRGYEYLHLEDLIVLCKDCHQTFHNKLT